MKSAFSKRYSLSGNNPAEEFFQKFHIELDPSLTPKYINLGRIGSFSNLSSSVPYDKTPIGNFVKGQGFNG